MLSADQEPVQVSDVFDWVSAYSIIHPVLVDANQVTGAYVPSGSYPTYVVIGRDMKIKVANLWPFDPTAIEYFF
jgi:hypothetical protein